jgi:F-type H+-transporting ATPase subunit b
MDRKKILFVLLLLPFFVFMSTDEEEHSSGFADFLGKTVNFVILFGGLTYLLYKPIRTFLEKRGQDIKLSLREAEDSKKEAERKLKEIESRLAGLEKEIEKIMKEAENEGRKERNMTLHLAQQETERIKHYTKQEIDAIISAGIRGLREYTAVLATALAEERIKKKMTPEFQSLMIDRSIERLSELDEKSDSGQKVQSRAG